MKITKEEFIDKFGSLSKQQKEAVMMTYKGMKGIDIAKKLGKHEGTIGRHLYNARKIIGCSSKDLIKLITELKEYIK